MDYLEIVTHFYKLFITLPELLLFICSNISDCVLDYAMVSFSSNVHFTEVFVVNNQDVLLLDYVYDGKF